MQTKLFAVRVRPAADNDVLVGPRGQVLGAHYSPEDKCWIVLVAEPVESKIAVPTLVTG